jgi:hypothetical protein
MYRSLAEEIEKPSWLLMGTVAVAAGLTTIAVPVLIDRLPVYVVVEPDWLTTHRVTGKSTTGFTIDFGTAPVGWRSGLSSHRGRAGP